MLMIHVYYCVRFDIIANNVHSSSTMICAESFANFVVDSKLISLVANV